LCTLRETPINSVNLIELEHLEDRGSTSKCTGWLLFFGSRFFLVLFGRGTGGQFAEEAEQGGCGFLIGKVFERYRGGAVR
jgi:hypothetical protein